VSLWPPRGPGLAGTRPSSPGNGQRGGCLVVRRLGVPERCRGGGDRCAVHADAAHHLVLDLHRVAGVEEPLGQEGLVGDLLGDKDVRRARPRSRSGGTRLAAGRAICSCELSPGGRDGVVGPDHVIWIDAGLDLPQPAVGLFGPQRAPGTGRLGGVSAAITGRSAQSGLGRAT
jgi:hypothetical protein